MQRREDNFRDKTKAFAHKQQYPSFSSTVLEKIYNSIDEGSDRTAKLKDTSFYRRAEITKKKAYKTLHEALILERNLKEKRASDKFTLQRRQLYEEIELKQRRHRDVDQDALFFSTSSSSSSESSSGVLSSSETDSVVGVTTRASCFRLKPVRTRAIPEKSKKTEDALFQNQSNPKQGKERAVKMIEQLKRSNQPISPGGRLVNFINSLFSSSSSSNSARKMNSSQAAASTCSSATSFSRSCLSKHSPSTKGVTGNRDRRSVQFYPIIDGDRRPGNRQPMEHKLRDRVETTGKCSCPLVKNYQENPRHHRSSYSVSKDEDYGHGDDEDDDDAISCSSSDLFELPVYETTRIQSNRRV